MKRVLLAVKAYPERSKTHGDVACTAGVTSDGEWIRLYPIEFDKFRGFGKLKRYSIIECECKKASGEKLSRKESYKVRTGSIKIVDTSLAEHADWVGRREWIQPLLANSIEELDECYKTDNTSLGLLKPKEILRFYTTQDIMTDLWKSHEYQMTIDGKRVPIVTKVPHQFKYRFTCNECPDGKNHEIHCEDWELLESYRSWGKRYPNAEELWEKLHDKFYSFVVNRDIHFFLGLHSQYPSWLIIGLFYPPQIPGTKQLSLNELMPNSRS